MGPDKKLDSRSIPRPEEPHELHLSFPHFPPIAERLLKMANDPQHSVEALADLIANDVAMQTQILQYARSFALNEGKPDPQGSIQTAITRVLGFDTVSHIALGMAVSRAFQVPEEGPLGLKLFWRHALCCATLAQKLGKIISPSYNIDPYMGYLLGLFHNFGLLLLGHLFVPEFCLLNKSVLANPRVSIEILEKRLLGMGEAMAVVGYGHAQLGAWLMHYWGMPEPVLTVTRFHHTKGYDGPYKEYVSLIQLTNQLLKSLNLGDGQSGKPSSKLLKSLGLTLNQVESVKFEFLKELQNLEHMARIFVS